MNSKYDELYMNEDDLIRARGIEASIKNGVMSVEEGHGLKEAIRKKYGYSGGADGSQYIKLDTQASGGFDGGRLLSALASGGNKWQKSLEDAAKNYTGMSYDDFTKGDDYASLAKRYSEQGQKAMNATLAEIAARTGGMASSYAATASQQSYNDYISRLEEAARSMYEGERADAAENLGVLQSLYDTEEDRKQTLANWAYQTLQDQKEDARYEREYADSRADADREWEYTVAQDAQADGETAKQEAREQVQMFFSNGGGLADLPDSLREAAGYTDEELAAMESRAQTLLGREAEEYKGSMAKLYAALEDDDGSGDDGELVDLYTALAQAGATDKESAYAILLANKYSDKAAENIATYFADTYLPGQVEDAGGEDPKGSDEAQYGSYEEAVQYAKENGITDVSGLMTPHEYNARNRGTTQSYFEYVDDFVAKHGGK